MKKKIIFIVPSMRGGGSERVMSIILNYLDRNKFDILLVLLKKEGQYLEDLKDDINILDLNVSSAKKSIIKIIKIIKQENPDIVFSTLGYLNILISIIRPILPKKIKFIARESSIVSIQNKQEKYPKLFDFLFKHFYKNFDLIISQSNYMKEDLIQNYNINSKKIKIIYNPVDTNKIDNLANEKVEKIELLAVGRLDKNKNFKDIIKVLPKLNKKLTILGEGQEKENLIQLANKLNVSVEFLGFQNNPYKYMKNAELLVITSLYEGFPNVVLEANVCELPVIAYNCIGGVRESISNGLNGFLIECRNINDLELSIKKALQYKWDKNKIKNYVNHKFSVSKIIEEYERLLNEL